MIFVPDLIFNFAVYEKGHLLGVNLPDFEFNQALTSPGS
jgi:hypothetical protein